MSWVEPDVTEVNGISVATVKKCAMSWVEPDVTEVNGISVATVKKFLNKQQRELH
jgi:hypothetical protein